MILGPMGKAMQAASDGMNVQAFRLRIASENLSNADTHGYHRKMISFENAMESASGQNRLKLGDVTLDQSQGEMLYEPNHPLANEQGFVTMSNVDMMIELADAREASRSYEANLTTFKQATQMYSSLISLLRK